MRSQACCGVQGRDAGGLEEERSRRYIFRISEADCSIISRTASVKGVSY